jgi:hypothetical protein
MITEKLTRYSQTHKEIIEYFEMGSEDHYGIIVVEGAWKGDLDDWGVISGDNIPCGDLDIIEDYYSVKDGHLMILARNGVDEHGYYIFNMKERIV